MEMTWLFYISTRNHVLVLLKTYTHNNLSDDVVGTMLKCTNTKGTSIP